MKFYRYISLTTCFLLIVSFLVSCEKEIKMKTIIPKNAIVVEGHIENDLQPYVLLTKNSPFFGDINVNDLGSYFIHNAIITVSTDDDSVRLVEYNAAFIKTLPDTQVIALAARFGIKIGTTQDFPDISIYTINPSDSDFIGKIGKRYNLRIEVEGKIISRSNIFVDKDIKGVEGEEKVKFIFVVKEAGEAGEIDAIPNLDINSHDVKVSHALSISKIKETDIWYANLHSLSEKESEVFFRENFLN